MSVPLRPEPSSDITRVVLFVLVIGALLLGSLWTLLPFLSGMIWATTIAVATWPLLLRIERASGGRRAIAVVLMTLTVLHQLAAAVWVGGLVQLVALWALVRREPDAAAVWPVLLARFSRAALIAVAALLAAALPLGVLYVGTVEGTEGSVSDITALGDNVNVAARLASLAAPGEALISEATFVAGGVQLDHLDARNLQ